MAVFTVIGFGLLLSSFKAATWSGLTISMLAASLNVMLGFLLQKFWFSTFILGFGNDNPVVAGTGFQNLFLSRLSDLDVAPSETTLRLVLFATISLLVAFTGFIGRVNIIQVLIITLLFCVSWNLSFFLNFFLNFTSSVQPTLFDDMGTTNVYLFGGAFGLMVAAMLYTKQTERTENFAQNKVSSVMSLAGTAFIFATFAMTGFHFPRVRNPFSYNASFLNNIFALSGSVVGAYIVSAFINKGKVGVREASISTITGGVGIGVVSGVLINPAASIAIGVVSGMISGLFVGIIHPKINARKVYDSQGILGSFFLIAFLGSLFVAPVVYQGFINNVRGSRSLTADITSNDVALIQLAYTGISLGVGLVTGLITGLIARCFSTDETNDFQDTKLFRREGYGLHKDDAKEPVRPESA